MAQRIASDEIFGLLGATDQTRLHATDLPVITVASMPVLGIGMACSSPLRAVGDAKRSMNATLVGALVTAALDPILIFCVWSRPDRRCNCRSHCETGDGGRCTTVHRPHHLLGKFESAHFAADARAVGQVSGPAILANLATPFGVAFVTNFMAPLSAAAVAGMATIDRLTPVAFGLVYALSGAVTDHRTNLGAGRIDRVRQTLKDSLSFMAMVAVGAAWLILALGQG